VSSLRGASSRMVTSARRGPGSWTSSRRRTLPLGSTTASTVRIMITLPAWMVPQHWLVVVRRTQSLWNSPRGRTLRAPPGENRARPRWAGRQSPCTVTVCRSCRLLVLRGIETWVCGGSGLAIRLAMFRRSEVTQPVGRAPHAAGPTVEDVRVDLGSGHIAVTEELRHGADRRTASREDRIRARQDAGRSCCSGGPSPRRGGAGRPEARITPAGASARGPPAGRGGVCGPLYPPLARQSAGNARVHCPHGPVQRAAIVRSARMSSASASRGQSGGRAA